MGKVLDVSKVGPNGLVERMSLAEYVEEIESCKHADTVIALVAGLPHRRMVWNHSVKVSEEVSVQGDIVASLWLLEMANRTLNLEGSDKASVRLTAFQAFGKFKENLCGSDGPPIVNWTNHEATNQRLCSAVYGLMEKLGPNAGKKPSGFEKFLAKDVKPLEMLRRACANLYSDACYSDNIHVGNLELCQQRLRQCLLDHVLYDKIEEAHCTGKQQGHSFAHEAAQHLAEHALSLIRAAMPWEVELSPAGNPLTLLRERRTLAHLQQNIREVSHQSGFGDSQAKKAKQILKLLMVLDSIITKAACELKPTGDGWWSQEE